MNASPTARRIYLAYRGMYSLCLTLGLTLGLLYQITEIGLAPFQLVLVGTVVEGTILLFEIPTGVVADSYSRRTSVLIGTFLHGVAFLVYALIPTFVAVLIHSFIWGVAFTFISGALDAWITDEGGEEASAGTILRGSQVGQVTSIVGIILSIILGNRSLSSPILLSGVGFLLLTGIMLPVMKESPFHPETGQRPQPFQVLRKGLNITLNKPALFGILVMAILWAMASEGFDRLWLLYLIRQFTFPAVFPGDPQVFWVALLEVASLGVAIGITEVSSRLLVRIPAVRLLIWLSVAAAILMIGFVFAPVFVVACLVYLLIRGTYTAAEPVYIAAVNVFAERDVRATVLSIISQVSSAGQASGGPLVGLVGNASLKAALLVSGFILSPVGILYPLAVRLRRQRINRTSN